MAEAKDSQQKVVLEVSNQTIELDDVEVHGDWNILTGARGTLIGNFNDIIGEDWKVTGEGNVFHDDVKHTLVPPTNAPARSRQSRKRPAAAMMTGRLLVPARLFPVAALPAPPLPRFSVHVGSGGDFDGMFGPMLQHRDSLPNLSTLLGLFDDDEAQREEKKQRMDSVAAADSNAGVAPASSTDAKDDGPQCKICMARSVNTKLSPCDHVCCCHACVRQILQRDPRCPVCRAYITSFERALVS